MGEEFIDIKSLAKLLNISLRTAENLIKAKQLPMYIKVGRQRRWRRLDIDKFFNQKLQEATESVGKEEV